MISVVTCKKDEKLPVEMFVFKQLIISRTGM